MQRLFVTLCAVVFLSNTTSVFAEGSNGLQHRLKGTYRLTGTETCAEAPGGFDTTSPQLPANGFNLALLFHIQGSIAFDGVETATATGTLMTVLPSTPAFFFPSPASTSHFSCESTYLVSSDNSFTMQSNCTVNVVTGEIAGVTDVISGVEMTGFIGPGGNVLIVSSTEPDARTLTRSNGYTAQRLCGATYTFVRANKPSNDNGVDD